MSTAPPDLSQVRCRNHGGREAVARCRECGNFFCRECVVEHHGRMVCTSCLAEVSGVDPAKRRGLFRRLFRGLGLAASFGFTWLMFSVTGRFIVFLREMWGRL